jgi:hypothetical protein
MPPKNPPPPRSYVVFSVRASTEGAVWVRAGKAFVNRDGSINVALDVLPLDGKLHLRESGANPSVYADDAGGDSEGGES